MKQNARCDYCAADLCCKEDSAESLGYLRTQYGLFICDKCLPKCSNDFPEKEGSERLFALRALHIRGIDSDNLKKVVEWNPAHGLSGLVEYLPSVKTGSKVRRPFAEANAASAADAAARNAEWQQRAQDLWATTQHAGKNATDVARLIARDTDGNANTIRRKIKKLS